MRLLRLDLTKRNFVEDFEIFETESKDLWEFGDLLFDQEMEYIAESCDHNDAEIMERADEVEYYVSETYLEFYYDGGFRSRFYLVDHIDNDELIEAALSNDSNVDSIGYFKYNRLSEILQKKLEKS